jgi:hypothetical protein
VVSGEEVMEHTGADFFVKGKENAITTEASGQEQSRADDDYLLDQSGRIFDLTAGKQRPAPLGRKFNPDIFRFAVEKRFAVIRDAPIDLLTEKVIGKTGELQTVCVAGARRTYVLLRSWPPPTRAILIPIATEPLDSPIVRLFAEVLTSKDLDEEGRLRSLDEEKWENRRRQLTGLVGKGDRIVQSLMTRVASDRWHWLRRRADENNEKSDLDRLISVEPIWQNFHRRGLLREGDNEVAAARDFTKAAKLAGSGYCHQTVHPQSAVNRFLAFAERLVLPSTRSADAYRVGFQLLEAIIRAKPDDPRFRLLLGIARYRTGHYSDALSQFRVAQTEGSSLILSQVGQCFMPGLRSALLHREQFDHDVVRALAFLAMTHHRLGHRDRALAALADLRNLGSYPTHIPQAGPGQGRLVRFNDSQEYRDLLREAESLIEGRPQPGT